jgi:hypothetical protein
MRSFTTFFALVFRLYNERVILADEQFLVENLGDSNRGWTRDIPKVLPAWRRWRAGDLPFSLKSTLRRDYAEIIGIDANQDSL